MVGGESNIGSFLLRNKDYFFSVYPLRVCVFLMCTVLLQVLNLWEKNVKHLWSLEMSQRLTYLKGDVHRMHAVVLEVSSVPCVMWAVLQGLHVYRMPYYGKKKSFPGFKYGCIFLPINIWNFFRKYIFVCSVLWLKSVTFVVKFQMRMCIISLQLICLLALNSCGKTNNLF